MKEIYDYAKTNNNLFYDMVFFDKTYYFLESKLSMILIIYVALTCYTYKLVNSILLSILIILSIGIVSAILYYVRYKVEQNQITKQYHILKDSHGKLYMNNDMIEYRSNNESYHDKLEDCLLFLEGNHIYKLFFKQHVYYVPKDINHYINRINAIQTINMVIGLNQYKRYIIDYLKKITTIGIITTMIIAFIANYSGNNSICYVINIVILVVILLIVLFSAQNFGLNIKRKK